MAVIENGAYIEDCKIFLISLKKDKLTKGVKEKFEKLMQFSDYPLPHLLYLKERFELTPITYFVLVYAFLYELDGEIANICYTETKASYLNIGYILESYSKIDSIHYQDIEECNSVLSNYILFKKQERTYYMNTCVLLQKGVFYYILGGTILQSVDYSIYYPTNEEYADIYQSEFEHLLTFRSNTDSVLIVGGTHTGKRTIIKRYCEYNQTVSIWINLILFYKKTTEEQEELIYFLKFILHLTEVLICFENVQEEQELNPLIQFFKDDNVVIVFTSEKVYASDCMNITLPYYLTIEDMHKMSQFYIEKDCILLQYHMNPEDMRKIYHDVSSFSLEDAFQRHCIHVSESDLYKRLKGTHSLHDWLGDEETIDQISHIIFIILHKGEYEHFIKRRKGAYTILFHGPSGTGKTMAAEIIGKETGLPVWQIDLSNILDKYIGESEKHLRKVFDDAQKNNSILLFDEADVLFSKRTSITSSHDKYANSSTAFLLQKIEDYEGVVILTSNLIHNLDDAFLRRIQFIIRFSTPDEIQCIEKWKVLLKDTELVEKFPYHEVVRRFHVSLAQIENICMNALFYQMREGSLKLNMKHLISAMKQECQKKQELLSPALIEHMQNNEE